MPLFFGAGRVAGVTVAVLLGYGGGAGVPAQAVPAELHGATAASAQRDVDFSDGQPRNARLTIPALPRVQRIPVIAYRGRTDDAPGTRIQNRGIAASPFGPRGGTGPGGLGNYQVTGHRTSHGAIFENTPSLRRGHKAYVETARWRYVYRIVKTRWVSFRSAKSLRAQRSEVPGRPGRTATRGYLTISTCATPEDHARGNYWADHLGNPEHRIDKIGVLVARVPNPHR